MYNRDNDEYLDIFSHRVCVHLTLFLEYNVFMSSKYHNTALWKLMIDFYYLIFMSAYSLIAYYFVAMRRSDDF